jgi:hypothetical protein
MGKGASRPAAAALIGLILIAATSAPLEPGLWEIRSTPGTATLDGKVLDDLPLGDARTERVCLASAQASDPIAFFARDTQQDCRITSASAAAGKVDISGSCPSPEDGSEGTMKLSGRYSSESYELDLATSAEDFQGKMTFSGKLEGRRIGPCPGS